VDGYVANQQQAGALRSSIAWALLGLVIERPSYGYELLQRFKRTYGETLALSSSAKIYTAIESLRIRSLIEEVQEREAEARTARRPKPRYRATEPGVRAYQDWLLMQLAEARQRERLFARQLAMLEPEAALGVIDLYERECLTESEPPEEAETQRQGVATRLAEEEEQLAVQVRLSWIEFARGELQALVEQGKPREEGGDPR
jgi:DNA-binding PadR family transcriptional regulator